MKRFWGAEKKEVFIKILIILIVTRLLILITGILSAIAFKKWSFSLFQIFDLFFKWDSYSYSSIVENGYSFIPGELSQIAFFPLYPLLVKVFSLILSHPKAVGFVISNTALFFACIYLYKLAKLDFNKSVAIKSVLFMLIAPASIYFSIFYTEGLFLFLAISSFYYARKKNWLTASILGFFLSLTRPVGFLIFIPLVMEYLNIDFHSFKIKREKIKKDILYLLLVPAGLLSYAFYLYIKFKDPLAYFHVQAKWGREMSIPLFGIFSDFGDYGLDYQILAVGAMVLTLILIIYLFLSRARLSYIIYSFLLFVFPLSTNLAMSIPRFYGVIFPIYFALALLTEKNKYLDYLIIILSVAFLSLITTIFVNGWIP